MLNFMLSANLMFSAISDFAASTTNDPSTICMDHRSSTVAEAPPRQPPKPSCATSSTSTRGIWT
ncbi:hypothetical protein PF008_g25769 [Phytophthora fragariae]|uniref:RxLR effector protein n=1 Tax=Phytophthora fragariae TaxID=53985 RepID=A0A6G0QJ08_9STRA|nr:hypothetical protein PF008_g25769 [Phytophthora fragariae]